MKPITDVGDGMLSLCKDLKRLLCGRYASGGETRLQDRSNLLRVHLQAMKCGLAYLRRFNW